MKKYKDKSNKNKTRVSIRNYKYLKNKLEYLSSKLSKKREERKKFLQNHDMTSADFPHAEYRELCNAIKEINGKLENTKEAFNHVKNGFVRSGILFIAGATLISGTAKIHYDDFTNHLNNAIETISSHESINKDDYDIKQIRYQPENVTALAENTIKAKIASVLNISDPSTIEIIDNSSYVNTGRYSLEDGYRTNIKITVNGVVIGEFDEFESEADGEIKQDKNGISKKLIEAILLVNKSKKSSHKGSIEQCVKADNALKSASRLELAEISLPEATAKLAEANTKSVETSDNNQLEI